MCLAGCVRTCASAEPAVAARPTPASSADVPSKPVAAELEPGGLEVRFERGVLTVRSNRVPRGRVLSEVARVLRCRLALNLPEDDLVSLSIEEPLEMALARLSRGLPYATTYEGPREHVLVELRVGAPQAQEAERAVSSANTVQAAPLDSIRVPTIPSSAPTVSEPRSPLEELANDELDHDARRSAAQRIPPVGTGASSLAQALSHDPDPRVRETAATQLGGGSGYATIDALLQGLRDEDPGVAHAALKSLQDIGDPSIIDALQAILSEQTNPEVSRAIDSAIGAIRSTGRPDSELPEVIEYAAPSKPEAEVPLAASESSPSAISADRTK